MSSVLISQVGTLDLLDLRMITRYYGDDSLPYPFVLTQGSRFRTQDEASKYASTVVDRFFHGDLNIFMESAVAYDSADIRVECHVQYIPDDTPCVRLIAYRAGQLGFFAAQRPDEDLVDIYTLSPYDLSTAICDDLSLCQPGRYPSIVIPEYLPQGRAEFDNGDLVVRSRRNSTEVMVPASHVTAYATVQSHWRPTRKWGPDTGKTAIVWVRVIDDGEYMYVPDHSHARPMTRAALCEQIDQLIANDVAILRELRCDYRA
ncbi:hypothetical protein MYSI104531_20125 [Mycobacterium simiae]